MLTIWLFFTLLLEDVSDFCMLMLATALVVEFFVLLLLLFSEEFLAWLEASLLALLEEVVSCDALLLLFDFAYCEASVSPELEAALADLDEFAAKADFEFALSASVELFVLFIVPEFAVAPFEVELLAEAPFEASAVWFADPVAEVLFAPLFDLLLNVELSVALAVPVGVAEADSLVLELLLALFLVLPLVAAAVSFSLRAFSELALNASVAAEALVAAFVLVSLLEPEAALILPALFVEDLAVSSFSLSVELELELWASAEVRVSVELLEALSLRAPTRLYVELLLFVSVEDFVLSDNVFAPCLYPLSIAPLAVSDWVIEFAWVTFELLLLLTVAKLPSQTFTPFATELSEADTTFTPFAPSIAVPEMFTDASLVVDTLELFAATAPPADVLVAPAVTLSICVSLMACALLFLVDDEALLWPNATPYVSTEAAAQVQMILFTVFSDVGISGFDERGRTPS